MNFDDVLNVMFDVAALVTRGSDMARSEARRVTVERERRTDEQARRAADKAALLPVLIVTVGGVEPPNKRLMALQAAIGKTAHLATRLGQLRVRLPRGRLIGIRLR